jgi:asparagine synthase (glutamine-hydrolysing)
MVHSLARRGPDSEGVSTWPGVALGHRRLAILDLSAAGHQPMLSDDGEVGIVFNGCIYNFLDIRKELEGRGHRFRSNCDTEVLVRGYQEWGIDKLAGRLHGMFAFGIWDHPRRTLTLVRDRLGVKPLVYWADHGEIAFASTLAALRDAGFGGAIDPQAVLDFLEYSFVTEDHAIYEGMQKLPPATILEWHQGRISQRQYWTLPEADESSRITFEEAVEEVERLIVDAVRLRLISDVPIGVLLSGGIDSALVCWGMSKLNANIRAFTVRAPNDPTDESADAAHTARTLGISHEIVDMAERDFSLDELVEAYSEPFACTSAQAMLWVSDAVRRKAKVLLTGDGGDDIFFGYPFFRNARMAQKVARALPASAPAVWKVAGKLIPAAGPGRRIKNFLNYATGGLGAHARAHDGYPYYASQAILGDRLAGRQLAQRQIPDSFDSARRLLGDVFEYHRRMHFTSEFMPKVDGGTMYFGIEARAPFLDQSIWEFAAALPQELRFHNGALKAVLCEIVRRHIGPETASRKKQGFTVPVERWLSDRWSGLLDNLRGDSVLERDGWVRRGSLRKPIQDALERHWVPEQVWRLLILEHWLSKNSRPTPLSESSVPAGLLSD